ncbi:bifunctional 3'-5' exonuclease/ATP-dependent helicase WRN-like [Littorina saxatilis]|uniref:bifunctional 3'-5' exonuclease/ATP-dependent helicase WRN-like n=1 Tax=Littorina saxatilis TaxID=31220 RepID=UPI0038B5D641
MASKRRKKRPLPDWVGESYDNNNSKNDEPDSSCRTEVNNLKSSSSAVASVGSEGSSNSTPVSDPKQSHNNKNSEASQQSFSGKNSKVEPLSAEEIVRLSLPLLKFEGMLVYSHNSSDCALLCEELMSTLDREGVLHVGFDMEWPVSYTAGADNKVALIQVCTAEDKCYLFHIAAMGTLPKALKKFLSDSRVVKYGINIESDFWKLERDFDDVRARCIIRESMKDLGKIANIKLKSTERWTLDGLTRNVFRKRLNKEGNVRCGKWDQYPLSEEQIQYAAADAYAGLLLAKRLCDV